MTLVQTRTNRWLVPKNIFVIKFIPSIFPRFFYELSTSVLYCFHIKLFDELTRCRNYRKFSFSHENNLTDSLFCGKPISLKRFGGNAVPLRVSGVWPSPSRKLHRDWREGSVTTGRRRCTGGFWRSGSESPHRGRIEAVRCNESQTRTRGTMALPFDPLANSIAFEIFISGPPRGGGRGTDFWKLARGQEWTRRSPDVRSRPKLQRNLICLESVRSRPLFARRPNFSISPRMYRREEKKWPSVIRRSCPERLSRLPIILQICFLDCERS